MANQQKEMINSAECLQNLPEIPLEALSTIEDEGLRRAELRHALRGIAQLTHVSEAALVRGLIEKILGRLPTLEE